MHAIMLYIPHPPPPPPLLFFRFFPIVTLLFTRSLTQFDFLSSLSISLDTQFPMVTIRKREEKRNNVFLRVAFSTDVGDTKKTPIIPVNIGDLFVLKKSATPVMMTPAI